MRESKFEPRPSQRVAHVVGRQKRTHLDTDLAEHHAGEQAHVPCQQVQPATLDTNIRDGVWTLATHWESRCIDLHAPACDGDAAAK